MKLKLKIIFLTTLLVSCNSFASILNIEQSNPRLKTNPSIKTSITIKNQKLVKKPISKTYGPLDSFESQISRDYELIFFYSLGCVYCKNFAPVLKRYSDSSGINVRGFILGTPDANLINQKNNKHQKIKKTKKNNYFPNSVIAEQEVIDRFLGSSNKSFNKRKSITAPALFIMNKNNFHAYPASQGALTYSELVRRMDDLIPKIINNEASMK